MTAYTVRWYRIVPYLRHWSMAGFGQSGHSQICLKRDLDPLIPNIAGLAVIPPILDLYSENAESSLPP